jgi:hypothetical protein
VVFVFIFSVAAFVLAGLIILARRGAWLIVFILTGSIGLVWITPWPGQFTRYLVPLAPFLCISAMLTLSRIKAACEKASREISWQVCGTIAAILALVFAAELLPSIKLFRLRAKGEAVSVELPGREGVRLFAHDYSWRAWEQAGNWLMDQAPPDAIIATSAPHWLYLRTGRRAVLPAMEAEPSRARQLLQDVPVSYVVVDKLEFLDITRRYAGPAMQSDPTGWHLIKSFGGTKIYAFVR